MSFMFWHAESFNQPLNNWNVSNVTYMNRMFDGAESFNQPLNKWNVSNVTRMAWMFQDATSFNQPLDNWNLSKVKYMENMFCSARSFNRALKSSENFSDLRNQRIGKENSKPGRSCPAWAGMRNVEAGLGRGERGSERLGER